MGSTTFQESKTAIVSDGSIPQTTDLLVLKTLEDKLCPKFYSSEALENIRRNLLAFLINCTHLYRTKPIRAATASQTTRFPYSQHNPISRSREESCFTLFDLNISDVIQLIEHAEMVQCFNWKYSCISSDKLIKNLVIVGVLMPQKDGRMTLEDQTGSICCVFFRGTLPFMNCPVDHKESLTWSLNCLVAITKFFIFLEKQDDDEEEQVYLMVDESSVLPLTDPISFSPSTDCTSAICECLNDLSLREKANGLTTDKHPLLEPLGAAESDDISYAFSKLSIKESCKSSIHECNLPNSQFDSETVKIIPNSTAIAKEEFFINQLIIPCKKTLPALRKNGKLGFRIEVLVVSNIFVKDVGGNVRLTVSDNQRRVENQSLEFDDIASYGKFQYHMTYVFKRPLQVISKENLKKCTNDAISASVINVTDECKFVPFLEATILCQMHNLENEELFEKLKDNRFRVTQTICLCSLSHRQVYSLSDLFSDKLLCSNICISVKGKIESKQYLKRSSFEPSDDKSDLKLTLVDLSSKIDLYLKLRHSKKHLLGLVPGSEVMISGVHCRVSKNDNMYLEAKNEAEFSLSLLDYSPQPNTVSIEVPVLPEERTMPLYFFTEIPKTNWNGHLFRSISFIIKITSLSIDHGNPPTSKACFLADDGSEQYYITCKDYTVSQLLGIDACEWNSLLHLAKCVDGGLRFKSSEMWMATEVVPEIQFLAWLCQRPQISRQMILLCSCYPCNTDCEPRLMLSVNLHSSVYLINAVFPLFLQLF